MATDAAQEKQQLHTLVEFLGPEQIHTLRSLVEIMLDPVSRRLAAAPIDDEPETDDERRAVAEALESLGRNGGVSMETVLADFGLTMDDFRRMAKEDLPGNVRG